MSCAAVLPYMLSELSLRHMLNCWCRWPASRGSPHPDNVRLISCDTGTKLVIKYDAVALATDSLLGPSLLGANLASLHLPGTRSSIRVRPKPF